MKKLSVVLATRNEEKNIKDCLESVRDIADEIIVVDESSTDNTREIANKCGAKVYKVKHEPIFHITKQKALDRATGEWVLQLDADERITSMLRKEIIDVVNMTDQEIKARKFPPQKARQFDKHTKILRDRGQFSEKGEVVAFLIPRLNLFLGKPLRHAGVYPDPAIRLIKNGKARFPAKSVHEIMTVDGATAWLFNDMEHHDSPNLRRYIERMNRYTDLHARDYAKENIPKNFFFFLIYTTIKPMLAFFMLYFRHKGFMDGIRGFLWSMFSAMRFPLSYFKYWEGELGK